jgi:hypothetical protein
MFQLDRLTLEVRDSRDHCAATIAFGAEGNAAIQTVTERFSIGRSGLRSTVLSDENGAVVARGLFSGIYQLVRKTQVLQWRPLSLWHAVYGWALADGTAVIRYVPAARWNTQEYLITVEVPVENELQLIAVGACLLRLAGTDFVARAGVTSAVSTATTC